LRDIQIVAGISWKYETLKLVRLFIKLADATYPDYCTLISFIPHTPLL